MAEPLDDDPEAYRALYAATLDPVFLTRPDGTIVDANAAACAMLGMSVEEIRSRGRAGIAVAEPALQEAVRERDRRGAARAPLRFRRQDGSELEVEVQSVVVAPGGEGWTAFVIARDVTERNCAVRGLRDSEARLTAILESLGDGFFAVDGDLRLVQVNALAAARVGLTREQVLGRPLTEVNPALAGSVPELELRRALERGQAVTFETTSALDHRRFEVRAFPGPGHVGVLFRDVTEARRRDAQLRASEERLRAVFEHATDAIIVSDPEGDGCVLAVNPAACRLFGYPEQEFLGLSRRELLDLADGRIAPFVAARAAVGQGSTELTYVRRGGERFQGELHSALYLDEVGQRRSVAIIRDVTERRRAEEEVRRSRAELRALAARADAVREEEQARIARDLHDSMPCARPAGSGRAGPASPATWTSLTTSPSAPRPRPRRRSSGSRRRRSPTWPGTRPRSGCWWG